MPANDNPAPLSTPLPTREEIAESMGICERLIEAGDYHSTVKVLLQRNAQLLAAMEEIERLKKQLDLKHVRFGKTEELERDNQHLTEMLMGSLRPIGHGAWWTLPDVKAEIERRRKAGGA